MGKLKLTVNEGKTRICKVPRPKLENGEVRRRQDCDADHIDCSNAGPLSTFSKSQRVMSVEGNCSDVGNPTSDAHPATVFFGRSRTEGPEWAKLGENIEVKRAHERNY